MSSIIGDNNQQQVIAYYRRSTDNRQMYSIERQIAYVEDFCKKNNLIILQSVEETFTSKTQERPGWNKALALAQEYNLPIVVKSLSRLGRDASSVIGTLNTEKIIVADKGLACDKLTLNLLAVIDQNERERISERTKAGLAVAKAKGVKLGNPNPVASLEKGRATQQDKADNFAQKMAKIILPLRESGASYQQCCDVLNEAEIPTRRGKKWTKMAVRNLVKRLDDFK